MTRGGVAFLVPYMSETPFRLQADHDQDLQSFELRVTLDADSGAVQFEWSVSGDPTSLAHGRLTSSKVPMFVNLRALDWTWVHGGHPGLIGCNAWPASVKAFVNRIRKQFHVPDGSFTIGVSILEAIGASSKRSWVPLKLSPGKESWDCLYRLVLEFAKITTIALENPKIQPISDQAIVALLVDQFSPAAAFALTQNEPSQAAAIGLRVTFDSTKKLAEFIWSELKSGRPLNSGRVRCSAPHQLTWESDAPGTLVVNTTDRRSSMGRMLSLWLDLFPTSKVTYSGACIATLAPISEPSRVEVKLFERADFFHWIQENLFGMAMVPVAPSELLSRTPGSRKAPGSRDNFERSEARVLPMDRKQAWEHARRLEKMAQLDRERRRAEQLQAEKRKSAQVKKAPTPPENSKPQPAPVAQVERQPLPPLSVHIEMPALEFQDTAFPLTSLRAYSLRERAAIWWVSNQSDDLLCLANCHIQKLDYQIRTALRVLGPLRGRVLLSGEVGLGKTIEAGLIIKELLTRGMVKRFLILTVPSLVDQWEEELSDKFGLTAVTTNQPGIRSDAENFWRTNIAIVASLHTLKQPAQLEIARQVHWDILVVDEAHYLRNRDSQAWQAVNALSRKFMLLLTATPVQNSLEELYNLVTLLQPGQLPTPKEFRARFIDPKRPRHPREPEELRRLLGQVMIRNTRANAGIQLPSRRAETVLFEPSDLERAFWQKWDAEFRAALLKLNPGHASLWGRLVLQAAGSSPAAWRSILEKFPDKTAARIWRDQPGLEGTWQKKCELIPPLTRVQGGAVIFTQFLETQAALAEYLVRAKVETFVINGKTPAPERHPITEEFRARGGALILTHSGTEGRNLQFCHRLANFDLPWNPMEIEQRIGRLHRIGQQHPVSIYNFVQSGTLQEHLLEILQEKLNLFELVVGETGLVLGERFGSDEFAEEILRRWRESEGRVEESLAALGQELAAARDSYAEIKQLDQTLFAKDYESI